MNIQISSYPEYKDTLEKLHEILLDIFPTALKAKQYNMEGWRIPVLKQFTETKTGTYDPENIYILLAKRKLGLTLHILIPNPKDYYFLDNYRKDLLDAGFKVRRACLVFERKKPYPFKSIKSLLLDIKNRVKDNI